MSFSAILWQNMPEMSHFYKISWSLWDLKQCHATFYKLVIVQSLDLLDQSIIAIMNFVPSGKNVCIRLSVLSENQVLLPFIHGRYGGTKKSQKIRWLSKFITT
jgi:hypothetical protein